MTLTRQQRRYNERMANKKHGTPKRHEPHPQAAAGHNFHGVVTGRTSAKGDAGWKKGEMIVMGGSVGTGKSLYDTDKPKHPKKGMFQGACNRSACQAEHDPEMGVKIQWWNRGSLSWYCGDCAIWLSTDIVNARHAEETWGPGAMLCVFCENEEDKANYPY